MTDDGSPPSAPRTNSAPDRSAHVPSCSAAAARNVSPAASSTERPASICCCATLPIEVVLPTPLTPTNIQTLGLPGSQRVVEVQLAVGAGETLDHVGLQRVEQTAPVR